MRAALVAVGLALFFLNPGLACGPAEPEFTYGAAEMRQAVEGTWSLTLTPPDGVATQVTVQLQQASKAATTAAAPARAGLVRAAHACGTRTLVKSVAACIDLSELPLTVSVLSGDPIEGPRSGNFRVYSLNFVTGELTLQLGAFALTVPVAADGMVGMPQLRLNGGATGVATVTRL